MVSHNNESQRGFTLIEMSIVLVIIGLIIGGVLKGQEMVASTRLKAVITQSSGIQGAVNTYVDRYNALPGNDPQASTHWINAVNGTGNGQIGGNVGIAGLGNAGQSLQFWDHLARANLITGVRPNAPAGTVIGVNLPSTRMAGTTYEVVFGAGPNPGGGAGAVTTNWLRFQSGNGAALGALTAKQAFEIETKVDDGVANTGSIQTTAGPGCQAGGVYAQAGAQVQNGCWLAWQLQN